jgi:hypothetical protein
VRYVSFRACHFEVLWEGVSARFGRPTIAKSLEKSRPTCCFVFQNLRLGSINLRLGGVELQKQISHTDPLFGIGRCVRCESCDFLAANSPCSPNEDFRRLDKASGVSFRGTLRGCEYSIQDGSRFGLSRSIYLRYH